MKVLLVVLVYCHTLGFHPQTEVRTTLYSIINTTLYLMEVLLNSFHFNGRTLDFVIVHFCYTNEHYIYPQGTPPEEGSAIFGLYLDGASWDSSQGCLQDSLYGQRFYPLPELHVIPIQVICPLSLVFTSDACANASNIRRRSNALIISAFCLRQISTRYCVCVCCLRMCLRR